MSKLDLPEGTSPGQITHVRIEIPYGVAVPIHRFCALMDAFGDSIPLSSTWDDTVGSSIQYISEDKTHRGGLTIAPLTAGDMITMQMEGIRYANREKK